MVHIAILEQNEFNKIINNERKTLLKACASRKIPHSRIFVSEDIYLVLKGSKSCSYKTTVKSADSLSHLTNKEIDDFFDNNKDKLLLSDEEKLNKKKKCLVFIELNEIQKIEPIEICNYRVTEDWLMDYTLNDILNRN